MAEAEFNPSEEGRRIARAYLSQWNWAEEWRRTLNRQLYPAVQREDFEAKERRIDQMKEEAEAAFSSAYDRWRKDTSPAAREVLKAVYELLKNRRDLGFIAQSIVKRLKQEFTGR
ncbi:MAG: hypothetical protein JW873_03925 [Candidatus Saganbacteria bacterium]|nr:hypothetical protein [Candidatus Saganbacteria bacterium]